MYAFILLIQLDIEVLILRIQLTLYVSFVTFKFSVQIGNIGSITASWQMALFR